MKADAAASEVSSPPARAAPWVRLLPLFAATVISLSVIVPRVWLVLALDGSFVAALLASAAGWGAWPAAWLLPERRTVGQRVVLCIGLGLGVVSFLTLGFGVAGFLRAESARGLVAAGVVLGALHLAHARSDLQPEGRGPTPPRPVAPAPGPDGRPARRSGMVRSLALLVIAPPLVVGILGASLPPGILWPGEARGYDALEYHLQCPREYFDAGRITFLPHNVYASFPQQQEMLYLLLMHLAGSPQDGAIPAQLLHLACGILFVCVVAAWAKPGWPRVIAVIAVGSTPWLAYLGCLAYVELPILYFGALAATLLLESASERPNAESPPTGRTEWGKCLAIGLLAGLAAGCKYVAIAMVAAALPVCSVIVLRDRRKYPFRAAAIMALGAAAAFSPWLIRNAAFTGNPVYPFASEWFDSLAWSPPQAAQWTAAHRLPDAMNSLSGRAELASSELILMPTVGRLGEERSLFGAAILLAALFGCTATRRTLFLALWSGLILVIWAGCTHMPGRFAVPLIIPAALLAGQVDVPVRRAWSALLRTIIVLAALLGALSLSRRLAKESLPGVPLNDLIGATAAWAATHPLNDEKIVPRDGFVWMVGDAAVFHVQRRMHYTTPFNRDPWLSFAESGADAPACVDWLRRSDVTHVAFQWAEIERLARPGNYGFSPLVTRAWVAGLAAAGLEHVAAFRTPSGAVFEEVYRVTP